MLTLTKIHAAHAKVKSGADFPKYLQELIMLGVTAIKTHVEDGHSTYQVLNQPSLTSEALYPTLTIATVLKLDDFKADLKAHQNGNTDFLTFCKDCAKSGIANWVISTTQMTCTYFDVLQNEVLIEQIPQ